MFKLDADDKQELLKTDLICLYETWHTTEQQLPDFLCEDYSILEHSFAIKDKQVGRPSGGILIISKKNTITRIIEKTEYWIIVKYTLDNLKDLTLGIFYFKPSLDDAVVMELIEDALGSVRMEEKLLMCGDFNARISDLNFVEEEILIGTALNEERLSKDLKHVICECPMYADVRSVFLKPILDQGNTLEQVLFNVDCSSMTSKLYAIHNFVCEAMKIRAFVSNQ
ncbi:hypothetical protein M8J75_012556 [Diaphorina citri]|nr:hypothetical protein M8J75_012556 [Diaphorina citri]